MVSNGYVYVQIVSIDRLPAEAKVVEKRSRPIAEWPPLRKLNEKRTWLERNQAE